MWDWEVSGPGGTITAPDGRTCWLQGDEAWELDDQVEACETEDQIQNLLSNYDHVCE
jgi:hypothetical protein